MVRERRGSKRWKRRSSPEHSVWMLDGLSSLFRHLKTPAELIPSSGDWNQTMKVSLRAIDPAPCVPSGSRPGLLTSESIVIAVIISDLGGPIQEDSEKLA